MSNIVVPPELQRTLSQAVGAVEVRGENGHVLGVFLPSEYTLALSKLEPEVDEAELQRRYAAGGGRPLADILRDLGATE
jgi:hypothetical protein